MMKCFVEIKTEFEIIHNWPECPYNEVSFLKYPHRHKIYIIVKIETASDRQIEFFMLKSEVDKIIIKLYGVKQIKMLGRKSMEEISLDILNLLKNSYHCSIEVSASEDNQVRGIIQYEPDIIDNPKSELGVSFE